MADHVNKMLRFATSNAACPLQKTDDGKDDRRNVCIIPAVNSEYYHARRACETMHIVKSHAEDINFNVAEIHRRKSAINFAL